MNWTLRCRKVDGSEYMVSVAASTYPAAVKEARKSGHQVVEPPLEREGGKDDSGMFWLWAWVGLALAGLARAFVYGLSRSHEPSTVLIALFFVGEVLALLAGLACGVKGICRGGAVGRTLSVLALLALIARISILVIGLIASMAAP